MHKCLETQGKFGEENNPKMQIINCTKTFFGTTDAGLPFPCDGQTKRLVPSGLGFSTHLDATTNGRAFVVRASRCATRS